MTTQAERLAMQASRLSIDKPGATYSHPSTYISGTGTAGTDNTAMTVKTLALDANVLTEVGDRLRVRAYWKGDTGTPVTGSLKLGPAASEVTIGDTTDAGGATLQVDEAWLHYLDNTHANIIEMENGALGVVSAVNVAGFTWNAAQNVLFVQSQALSNHCVVYAVIVDIYKRGAA